MMKAGECSRKNDKIIIIRGAMTDLRTAALPFQDQINQPLFSVNLATITRT
jgi:hypothetical protein